MVEHESQSGDAADDVVGVIGLGAIGGPVARALARAGRNVVGFDVDPAAYSRYPEATATESPRALADLASIVLIAVYNDEQLRDVLTGPSGVLSGGSPPKTICVLSTVTLTTLLWAAEEAAAAGAQLIDCGVTGGSGLRSHGKIVVLAGGSAEALAAARSTLEVFAAPLMHMGALGAGMRAKLARNLMHYSGWYASWEAARIAAACDIDVLQLVEAHRISNEYSSGGGASLLIAGVGPGPADPTDEESMASRRRSADFAKKDLAYVLALADNLGIPLPGAELVRERIGLVVGLEEEAVSPSS